MTIHDFAPEHYVDIPKPEEEASGHESAPLPPLKMRSDFLNIDLSDDDEPYSPSASSVTTDSFEHGLSVTSSPTHESAPRDIPFEQWKETANPLHEIHTANPLYIPSAAERAPIELANALSQFHTIATTTPLDEAALKSATKLLENTISQAAQHLTHDDLTKLTAHLMDDIPDDVELGNWVHPLKEFFTTEMNYGSSIHQTATEFSYFGKNQLYSKGAAIAAEGSELSQQIFRYFKDNAPTQAVADCFKEENGQIIFDKNAYSALSPQDTAKLLVTYLTFFSSDTFTGEHFSNFFAKGARFNQEWNTAQTKFSKSEDERLKKGSTQYKAQGKNPFSPIFQRGPRYDLLTKETAQNLPLSHRALGYVALLRSKLNGVAINKNS